MPLPASASSTVIQGRILDVAGNPLSATITLTPVPERIVVKVDDTTMYRTPVSVDTDPATGAWELEVLSSDDPDLDPTGWTYTLTVKGPLVSDTITGVPAPKDAPVDPGSGRPTVDITELTLGSSSSGTGVAYRLAGLADVDVTTAAPVGGQALVYDDLTSSWKPGDSSGVSSWDDLTDKPATFPPSAHTHATSEVTGLDTALAAKAEATDALAVPRATGGAWPARPAAQHVTWIETLPATPLVPAGMVDGDLYLGPNGLTGLPPGGTP
ncbi:hypothetical protein ABN028_20075 [Actinopolymorpha sp. B17G11]|uniref:hypothetical protein n=1 Tax=Actinopolymorpha sp. B17G11 TaxID=3160861 RepID=UPI0032E3F714